MTDDEIREICREWASGEHFPVDDVDEQQLTAAMAAEPEHWWTVLREMIEQSPNVGYGENLSWVLAPLIGVRGRAWRATVVEETRGSPKAIAVVADAFWTLQFHDGELRVDPLEAYDLLGRELVVTTWLRHLSEASSYDWDFWPYNLVTELIDRRPDEAWTTITAMIEQAPLEHAELLGAGFLEDLLGGALGDAWIERVEELAARSERFRRCPPQPLDRWRCLPRNLSPDRARCWRKVGPEAIEYRLSWTPPHACRTTAPSRSRRHAEEVVSAAAIGSCRQPEALGNADLVASAARRPHIFPPDPSPRSVVSPRCRPVARSGGRQRPLLVGRDRIHLCFSMTLSST